MQCSIFLVHLCYYNSGMFDMLALLDNNLLLLDRFSDKVKANVDIFVARVNGHVLLHLDCALFHCFG